MEGGVNTFPSPCGNIIVAGIDPRTATSVRDNRTALGALPGFLSLVRKSRTAEALATASAYTHPSHLSVANALDVRRLWDIDFGSHR